MQTQLGPDGTSPAGSVAGVKRLGVSPVPDHPNRLSQPIVSVEFVPNSLGRGDEPGRRPRPHHQPVKPRDQLPKHLLPPPWLAGVPVGGLEPGRLADVGGDHILPKPAEPLGVDDVESTRTSAVAGRTNDEDAGQGTRAHAGTWW